MQQEYLSDEMYWGLSLSALPMHSLGKCNHRSLFGFDHKNEHVVAYMKSFLVSLRIFNAKDAKDRLYHYRNDHMHNKMFVEIMRHLDLLNPDEFKEHMEALESPFDIKRHRLVWAYKSELRETGIRGYDIAQYVMLMRLYGVCGYLDEDEIRRRIFDVSEQARKIFGSWDAYNQNVLVGDQFVKGYEIHNHSTMRSTNPMLQAYYSLLNTAREPDAPFYQLNWAEKQVL